MSRGFLILFGIVILAAAAWCGTRAWRMGHATGANILNPDALAWVQREFALDGTAFAKVKALHESYQPRCAELCHRISEANARVQHLLDEGRGMTPELAEAIRTAQQRHAECQTAMLTHIYETAALMPPEAAQRYLKTITARIMRDGQCIADVMAERP